MPGSFPAWGPHLADAPLQEQIAGLEEMVRRSGPARRVLALAAELDLPGWYFGAGGVCQTVWNLLHGRDPAEGIKDYDRVYFDRTDLSEEAEDEVAARAVGRLGDPGLVLDVKNEARVHLWYRQRFGREVPPYTSTEQAIGTWPSTASSVGVRDDSHDRFVVCAPFGLRDVFAMVARPNKAIVPRAVYEEKANRWAARWPRLTVVPW